MEHPQVERLSFESDQMEKVDTEVRRSQSMRIVPCVAHLCFILLKIHIKSLTKLFAIILHIKPFFLEGYCTL